MRPVDSAVADSTDLVDLEMAVMDVLDAGDDAAAPPGTFPLSAARRRRGLHDAHLILGW